MIEFAALYLCFGILCACIMLWVVDEQYMGRGFLGHTLIWPLFLLKFVFIILAFLVVNLVDTLEEAFKDLRQL